MQRVQLKKNKDYSGGFTLVEIIVSMLIISMIAMPLLNMFLMTKKANQRARRVQYGTMVAQNVLETVEEIGVENFAKQVHSVPGYVFNMFSKVTSPSLSYHQCKSSSDFDRVDMLNASGLTVPDDTESTVVKLSNGLYVYNNLQKQFYLINNIKEGTMLFDVVVELNTEAYDNMVGEYNDYVMPDVSTLNADTTMIIYPDVVFADYSAGDYAGKTTSSHDKTAIEILYGVYRNAITNKNAEISEANLHAVTPAPYVTALTKSQFADKLKKSAAINIDYNSSSNKYELTCELKYVMPVGTGADKIDDYGMITVESDKEYVYNVFGDGVKQEIETLENIYYFYAQFAEHTTSTFGDPVVNYVSGGDTINFNITSAAQNKLKASGTILNIFIPTEEGYCSPALSQISVNTNVSAPESILKIKTNKNVFSTTLTSSAIEDGDTKHIVADTGSKTRIYQVVVTVYSRNGGTERQLVTTMSTTITN